ncbi:HD domain-containing protein [Kitasatospora nipponensis]|uniref:HD domain-containing protein n=1 Tax=Kitasatospora nipponensis TaxID=258049 RepID=A0ABN1WMY8_9ACTN
MTASPRLLRALHDTGDLPLRPLPARAVDLLQALAAPPRLAAHLRAVHDVAAQLLDWTERHRPALAPDRAAVLFGAATHDIGKILHPAELQGPGSAHEEAGRALLLAHGTPAELARFAGTHGSWQKPEVGLNDLLVSLADTIWKGRRIAALEDLVVARLAAASGRPGWEEFLALDDLLTRLGDDAPARLAFQASHPTEA